MSPNSFHLRSPGGHFCPGFLHPKVTGKFPKQARTAPQPSSAKSYGLNQRLNFHDGSMAHKFVDNEYP